MKKRTVKATNGKTIEILEPETSAEANKLERDPAIDTDLAFSERKQVGK